MLCESRRAAIVSMPLNCKLTDLIMSFGSDAINTAIMLHTVRTQQNQAIVVGCKEGDDSRAPGFEDAKTFVVHSFLTPFTSRVV